MKKNIDRLLFCFQDGEDRLVQKNHEFFPWGLFLTRLLDEKHNSPKIKFINLEFNTEKTYLRFPKLTKYLAEYHGGNAWFYNVLDVNLFNGLTKKEQLHFIWERGYEMLKQIAIKIKHGTLLEAAEYAYHKGLAMGLNPDYKVAETNIILFGEEFQAAVLLHFDEAMVAKVILEANGKTVFEKEIYKAPLGNEYFLTVFKKIEVRGMDVIVSGKRDAQFLPFKVSILPSVIHEKL